MTVRDRVLYHQLHPIKLATDVGSALGSLFLFWHHALVPGLLVLLLPPIAASGLLIRFADLSRTEFSPAGSYLRRFMTRRMELFRLLGMAGMVVGAWWHAPWLIGLGASLIAWGWAGGWAVDRLRK
jgi:hypothetical protein